MFPCALAQIEEPHGLFSVIDRVARLPLSKVVLFLAAATLLRIAFLSYIGEFSKDRGGIGLTLLRVASEVVDIMIYAGTIVFLIIRPFIVQTFWIPSESMLDTLQIRDFVIANKLSYRFHDPEPGDIVVFRPPDRAILPGHKKYDFIKRCIGVPGDTIEIRDSVLYRNGKAIPEPYVRSKHMDSDFKLVEDKGRLIPVRIEGEFVNTQGQTPPEYFPSSTEESERWRESPPAKIPEGFFLMMGDNRNQSHDGRTWGLVPRRDIIARSEFIWLPISRWRRTS